VFKIWLEKFQWLQKLQQNNTGVIFMGQPVYCVRW